MKTNEQILKALLRELNSIEIAFLVDNQTYKKTIERIYSLVEFNDEAKVNDYPTSKQWNHEELH